MFWETQQQKNIFCKILYVKATQRTDFNCYQGEKNDLQSNIFLCTQSRASQRFTVVVL